MGEHFCEWGVDDDAEEVWGDVCGEPATKSVVTRLPDNCGRPYPRVIWLCDKHYNDPDMALVGRLRREIRILRKQVSIWKALFGKQEDTKVTVNLEDGTYTGKVAAITRDGDILLDGKRCGNAAPSVELRYEDGHAPVTISFGERPEPANVQQNRYKGDLIVYGAISALFDDIPEAMVTCNSGTQQAFDAAYDYIHRLRARVRALEKTVGYEAGDYWRRLRG